MDNVPGKTQTERTPEQAVPSFSPKLTTTDWNDEWIRLQDFRKAFDDSSFWDKKAPNFHKSMEPNDYVLGFIECAELEDGDVVFDMGCGNGAIAIPLALAGHKVIACDFSKGMLSQLEDAKAKAESESGRALDIEIHRLSWQDDWKSYGIEPKCADVALASRSIATHDLGESLEKLSNVARRRCSVTLPTGSSPRTDEHILSAIGVQNHLGRDYIYAFMILAQMGYYPEVSYIPSTRKNNYEDFDEAFSSLSRMVEDASRGYLNDSEIKDAIRRLEIWLQDELVDNPDAGRENTHGETEGALMLKCGRLATWADIAWNVCDTHQRLSV